MRPIEIRGTVYDIDELAERGRALHGDAFRGLFVAGWRAVRRAPERLRQWRRNRAPEFYARRPCVDRLA